MRTKDELLHELNAGLPPGIDWHTGAIQYLETYFQAHPRRSIEHYAFTKPLTEIAPENDEESRAEICHYIHDFTASIQLLKLARWSKVLDVACGSGWITHWLCRLGYEPLGIDICADFIDLAKQRIKHDPYLVRDVALGRPGSNPEDLFKCHNIETDPLGPEFDESFDAAILESCLHHFIDPIQVLKNIAFALKESGLVLILEGENRRGAIQDPYLSAMVATNTLERPLPRELLIEALNHAGLKHYEVLGYVSGFISPRDPRAEFLSTELKSVSDSANVILCAKSAEALHRVLPFWSDAALQNAPPAATNIISSKRSWWQRLFNRP